ncbi:MAG TPA: hypothetical protein VKA70_05015 [Blastocatellia bacterium]|nr:hypothetical protein [Blastocatellia bacterium]
MQNQTNRLEKKGFGTGGPRPAGDSVDDETVLREFEKANLILESDPDLIESMSKEEVEQQMAEMGITPKPLPEEIKNAIRGSGKKPSTHNDTKGGPSPEAAKDQRGNVAEQEESRPRTRVAVAGESNVVSIDKNKRAHTFVGTDHVRAGLPLIVWAAAVVILTANIGPILRWLIDSGSGDLSVWSISVAGAMSISTLLTTMIGYNPPNDSRRIVSRSAVLSALALTIVGGVTWFVRAGSQVEAAFAAVFSILGVYVILFLRRVASAFGRAGSDVLPVGAEATVSRLHNHVAALVSFWRQCGDRLFKEGKGLSLAEVGSAVFLICVASGGIGDWQYQTVKADSAEQGAVVSHARDARPSSPDATSDAKGNPLKGEPYVVRGQIGRIVIKLPKDREIEVDKAALATYLKVRPEEIQVIEWPSRSDLPVPPQGLGPKLYSGPMETESVDSEELKQE